jgi:hypothetical protein
VGKQGRDSGGEDSCGGPVVDPEGRDRPVAEVDAGEARLGVEEALEHGPGSRRILVPHPIRPGVAVTGDELVHGLEEEASVLGLDVDVVFLFQPARGRPGDLAVTLEHLAARFQNIPRHGLSIRSMGDLGKQIATMA